MTVLMTGTAGFIGYHLAERLLATGQSVIGLDGFVPYYDPALKLARHRLLERHPGFTPVEMRLENAQGLAALMAQHRPGLVVHLAAQAGVRHSLDYPADYLSSNVIGTFNVLEACRAHPPRHLLIASTSSAYGANDAMPFREMDRTATPLTIYAASKISTELIAHCYAHLWGLPITLFRFFTVYGPWGRPDMAYWIFTERILRGEPVQLNGNGLAERDFTQVDDLVEAVVRLMDVVPPAAGARSGLVGVPGDTLSPAAPHRIVNIGRGQPEPVTRLVDMIEASAGRKVERRFAPLPAGDVQQTFADANLLEALTGYRPSQALADGIPGFVNWYRNYRDNHKG